MGELALKGKCLALKGKCLRASLCKISFGAGVYNVWRQRNDIQHGNPIKTEEHIVTQIVWEVRTKIMSRRKLGLSRKMWIFVTIGICMQLFLYSSGMAVLMYSLFALGAVLP